MEAKTPQFKFWPRICEIKATLYTHTPAVRRPKKCTAQLLDEDELEYLVADLRMLEDSKYVKMDHGVTAKDRPVVADIIIVSSTIQHIKSVAISSIKGIVRLSGECLRAMALLENLPQNTINPLSVCPILFQPYYGNYHPYDPVSVSVAIYDECLTVEELDAQLTSHLHPDVASLVLEYATLGVEVDVTTFIRIRKFEKEQSWNTEVTRDGSNPFNNYFTDSILDALCPVTKKAHLVKLQTAKNMRKLIFWYSTPKILYLDILKEGNLRSNGCEYPFTRELVLNIDKLVANEFIPSSAGVTTPIYTLSAEFPDAADVEMQLILSATPPPNTSLNMLSVCGAQNRTEEERMGEWRHDIMNISSDDRDDEYS